jgi:hypothetical protein
LFTFFCAGHYRHVAFFLFYFDPLTLRLAPIRSFFFFGGLSIPVSQAILAHLFSYNITWSATVKEVQRSNFFKEIPKIIKRFWFQILFSVVVIGGMIVCSTSVVPLKWRVDESSWAVIFPLAYVEPLASLFFFHIINFVFSNRLSTACHILVPVRVDLLNGSFY